MKTKQKVKLPPFGTLLIILAALSNVGRWVGMYLVSDNAPMWVWTVTPWLNIVSALSTALVIAGGLSFVAHRLGNLQPTLERKVRGREEKRTFPNIRFWTAAVAGIGILAMSAFLLPPYIRMMLPAELSAQIGNVKAWSVMSVLVGDMVIVAIAMVDGKSAGFTSQSVAGSSKSNAGATESSKRVRTSAKGPMKSVAVASKYPRKCDYCDELLASSNAVGGHMKKHHPDMCKKKSLADSLFERVEKQ